MLKAHEIRLYPTKAQAILLKKSCGIARYSYNWALTKWIEMDQAGERPTAYTLIKLQNSIKKEQMPYFLEVSKNAPQYAIHHLELAYKNFHRLQSKYGYKKFKIITVKRQKKTILEGIPQYKRKGIHDSFVAIEKAGDFSQSNYKIHLSRIGKVKCAENLRFTGKINNVVVKRIADKWFAVINIDTIPNEASAVNDNQVTVGVDLGIKSLIVLSDGTIFENPKALRKNLDNLKRQQRFLSRKQMGSNNRRKQQMKVANIHYRISCIRKYAIHKATSEIVSKYDRIIIEDLNISGMMKNHHWAQAIGDASMGEVTRQLAYKAMWQGKELIKVDRFFPSSKICSCCGYKKETLLLSERTYKCDNCGLEIDRDLNAAINLANYSPTSKFGGSNACGDETMVSSMKQEVNRLSINS
jgi:putative transposase